MSAWLQQAKAMDDYAKLAERFAIEYAAEGDEIRAARYRDDAIWYGERAGMYRERHQAWLQVVRDAVQHDTRSSTTMEV